MLLGLLPHKLGNYLQSGLLVGAMAALMGLIGYVLAGWPGFWWTIILGGVFLAMAPRVSPKMLLGMYGARKLDPDQAPRLHTVVERLSRRADLKRPPEMYYIPSQLTNAFTMGTRSQAAMAVTDGLLRSLTLRELAGVLAHEMSHIRNNDMWVMSLADIISRITSGFSLFGQLLLLLNLPLLLMGGEPIPWLVVIILIFAPTVTALLQLALSRSREYEADKAAVDLTHDPEGLAAALTKLEKNQVSLLNRLFRPGRKERQPSVLRTHPHTEERVRRLLEMRSAYQEEDGDDVVGDIVTQQKRQPERTPRRRYPGLWY
jgi:heat shock protein HtpX